MAQRVGGALLPLGQPGQAVVDPGLADVVADLLEPPQRVQEQRVGVAEAPGAGVPEGEAVQGVRLPRRVAELGGGVPAGLLRQGVVVQDPLRRKNVLSVHASCQACRPWPAGPAARTAASSPGARR